MSTVTAVIDTPHARNAWNIAREGNAGFSFFVPGMLVERRNGAMRAIKGCRDEREAFTCARRLWKSAGHDVTGWKLRYLA